MKKNELFSQINKDYKATERVRETKYKGIKLRLISTKRNDSNTEDYNGQTKSKEHKDL